LVFATSLFHLIEDQIIFIEVNERERKQYYNTSPIQNLTVHLNRFQIEYFNDVVILN